ncbi:MAG: bifunctional phosphoribosyl-AMP cyclohydrolase/phosphoribosyl-ATP diphosphatase HisIE [Gemmatimonadota bacterium]|nr:bifunctional phosphoribosyl-AMP cyclohydrolase/phosphoribosyl-ATP diphosphatase HisIE [Gemmatimonadota bacterium]
MTLDIEGLRYDKERGTVVVVAQDAVTGRVLMVAHADREALAHTLRTGEMHYRSRTRGLWHKGATSGNVQRVVSLSADCDNDTVLARVISAGPACHSGEISCFGGDAGANAFADLAATIALRAAQGPGGEGGKPSYTRKLLDDRNLRLKKIGEESAELVAACADEDRQRATEEAADLIYHIAVALKPLGSGLEDVALELYERSGGKV